VDFVAMLGKEYLKEGNMETIRIIPRSQKETFFINKLNNLPLSKILTAAIFHLTSAVEIKIRLIKRGEL
jgi:hypothetical protein